MKQPTHEERSSADLSALAAVAQGSPAPASFSAQFEDPARNAKIDELKTRYQSGQLAVDNDAIAAKLVDSHIQAKKPG